MSHILSLNENNEVYLPIGIYNVDIVGGWFIKLNNFQMNIENISTGKILNLKEVVWKIQSYVKGRRSKRVFSFEVLKAGNYKITFLNTEKIKVKHTNLPISWYFYNFIPSEKLQIKLYK